jgi:tetratricopeptide (TPR) repeat protein
VSFVSRLYRRIVHRRALAQARQLEDAGDLAAAASAFERGGAYEEAMRLMLLLAETETEAKARARLLGRAARLAEARERDGEEGVNAHGLLVRYARARLELAEQSGQAERSPAELSTLGHELLGLGSHDLALQAFRLAEDREGELKALADLGAVDQLEGLLSRQFEAERRGRESSLWLAQAIDLEASGQRLAALNLARRVLRDEPADERAGRLVRDIEARLCPPAALDLEVLGERGRWVFGAEVIVGRGKGCQIVLLSPSVSRRHLRIAASPNRGGVTIEGLNPENGVRLARVGARVRDPVSVTGPLDLLLADLPCRVAPHEGGGVVLTLGNETYRLPLGPVAVGPWSLDLVEGVARLSVPEGATVPYLSKMLATRAGIDLCVGDELSAERGGAPLLKVLE